MAKTHGMSRLNGKKRPEYLSWSSMHRRCSDVSHVSFHNYGSRGIGVCERWSGVHGLANFIEDMGPRPHGKTLERRDNSRGYSPDNCYWATHKEQCGNKRSHGWDRLTPEQAVAIRIDPRRPYRVIAADYGVTRHMVGMIIRGDAWQTV